MAQQPETEISLEAVHDFWRTCRERGGGCACGWPALTSEGYQDRAVALGLTGIVEFLGPVAHAEARRLQRRADLLVIFKPYGPAFDTMVPGKLYEYLDAGRPLVALLEPEQGGGGAGAPGRRGGASAGQASAARGRARASLSGVAGIREEPPTFGRRGSSTTPARPRPEGWRRPSSGRDAT